MNENETITARDYMKQKAILIVESINDTETLCEILSYCEYLNDKLKEK